MQCLEALHQTERPVSVLLLETSRGLSPWGISCSHGRRGQAEGAGPPGCLGGPWALPRSAAALRLRHLPRGATSRLHAHGLPSWPHTRLPLAAFPVLGVHSGGTGSGWHSLRRGPAAARQACHLTSEGSRRLRLAPHSLSPKVPPLLPPVLPDICGDALSQTPPSGSRPNHLHQDGRACSSWRLLTEERKAQTVRPPEGSDPERAPHRPAAFPECASHAVSRTDTPRPHAAGGDQGRVG